MSKIKELRFVPANDLRANPKNWRRHPARQRQAMGELMTEVGMAGVCLAYEVDGELVLIDGHLRSELMGDDEIPVVVLDLSPEQADELLIRRDTLPLLADVDREKLASLVDSLDVSEDLRLTVGAINEKLLEEPPEKEESDPTDRVVADFVIVFEDRDSLKLWKRFVKYCEAAEPFMHPGEAVTTYLETCLQSDDS